jgi:RecA/RadA recombinase
MKQDDLLSKAFKTLDALNPEATFLSENALCNVDTWYDTGCYALNAIVSGKLKDGGIPKGRITIFAGPSQTGKTLLVNKILGIAQKKGIIPVIFDTEFAIDKTTTAGVGLDPDKTKYVPVFTIENARNQISTFLDSIVENNLQGKFIISLDSLGNLAGSKEVTDVEKDKSAADMGTRAKGLKSMLRLLTYKAGRAGVPILMTNHTYSDPASLYPSLVQNQSGGSGPLYMASVIVQLAKKNEKQESDEEAILPEARNYSGVTLRALTVKNRFVPPFLEASINLNYLTGLDKYSGLLEMAVNHGLIIQTGSTYTKPDGTKLGYAKSFTKDKKFYEELIPLLDKKLEATYKYGNVADMTGEVIGGKEE